MSNPGIRNIDFSDETPSMASGSQPSELSQLQQMVYDLQQQLSNQQSVLKQQSIQISQQNTQIETQRLQIQQQYAQLQALQTDDDVEEVGNVTITPIIPPMATMSAPTAPTATVPFPAAPQADLSSKLKVNKPQEFHGKREHTSTFIAQCRLSLRSTPFAPEDQKIAFVCSYLRGTAFKWYANLEKMKQVPATADLLFDRISEAFGESDTQEKARTELDKLRQTKSCASYTTEFNRLITEIGYTDPVAIIDLYKKGLKENVKDLMLTLTLKNTVAEYQKDAIACDVRLFQRAQEQRSSKPASTSTPRPPAPTPKTDGPTPMEIDSVSTRPKGKVSDEEKKRRKELNLCPYDGESTCPGKDDIKLCKNLARKNEKRSATTADRK